VSAKPEKQVEAEGTGSSELATDDADDEGGEEDPGAGGGGGGGGGGLVGIIGSLSGVSEGLNGEYL